MPQLRVASQGGGQCLPQGAPAPGDEHGQADSCHQPGRLRAHREEGPRPVLPSLVSVG